MCADVAENTGRPDPASSFTVGVLSILDALMDVPMRDVINPLPLADDVKAPSAIGTATRAACSWRPSPTSEQRGTNSMQRLSIRVHSPTALSWSERVLSAV